MRFGHFGCKLLRKLKKKIAGFDKDTIETWDRIGKWKDQSDSTGKLATAIAEAMISGNFKKAVLYDTMRKGSDYWRPSNLLLQTAAKIKTKYDFSIYYARDDTLCPPEELLNKFLDDSKKMSFGDYAD